MEEELDELFDLSGIGDTDFAEMFAQMLDGEYEDGQQYCDYEEGV